MQRIYLCLVLFFVGISAHSAKASAVEDAAAQLENRLKLAAPDFEVGSVFFEISPTQGISVSVENEGSWLFSDYQAKVQIITADGAGFNLDELISVHRAVAINMQPKVIENATDCSASLTDAFMTGKFKMYGPSDMGAIMTLQSALGCD